MQFTELEQTRKNRLDKIRELDIDPFGRPVANIFPIKARVDEFGWNEHNGDVFYHSIKWNMMGRIVLLRDNGGLVWLKIRDDTGEIQVAISKKDVINEKVFQVAKLLDLGDIVQVSGIIKRTKTGEITVWARDVLIACKSLAHPPDKVAGLQDVEQRYRKRYADMAYNSGFIDLLKTRSQIISLFRQEFTALGFLEVETPMLHPIAGGAAAKPFETHLNALDIPLFLRVAPELYLKKLIAGGMQKIFEINRNFRNEGIDSTHNPEFTALEAYAANANCEVALWVIEKTIKQVAMKLRRKPTDKESDVDLFFEFNGHKIDFNKPFERIWYHTLYAKGTGKNFFEESDKILANKIFEEKCEPLIDPTVPTFVYDYPLAVSPLTKVTSGRHDLAQRADLFIGGMEIGTAYTEQNDPEAQYKAFTEQLSEDDEESTHRTLDEDFIEALKVGMPPTGGLGLGIDRLVMLFTNQTSIRDVLAFPFMRPLATSTVDKD